MAWPGGRHSESASLPLPKSGSCAHPSIRMPVHLQSPGLSVCKCATLCREQSETEAMCLNSRKANQVPLSQLLMGLMPPASAPAGSTKRCASGHGEVGETPYF